MAAQTKKSQDSLIILVAVAVIVLIGFLFLNSKSSNVSSPTPNSVTLKASAKPVAVNNQVTAAQSSSGPVGRNALRAYAGPGVGEVTLEWQRFYADGENFSIHYGTKSKEYPYQASHIGYISTYTIKNLTPGQVYYFVVEGIRAGNVSAGWDGEVAMTAPASLVMVAGTAGPVGRNLLTAKAGPKTGQVTLNWTRFYPDTEKYHIVYGTKPGVYSYGLLNAVDTTPGDNNYSIVIGSLSSGTRYYFALDPQRSGTGIYIYFIGT